MPDEHTTHTEEDARPSDSFLQRRTGNLRSPDSRSDGERDDSVEPDWSRPSCSNGQLQQDHLHEAELIDHFQGVVQAALTSIRVAPIPDPRELQEYENIEAGFANRIITMAEESAAAANTATLSNAEINNAVAESIREESRSIKR